MEIDCEGCEYEFDLACEYIEKGLYLATSIDYPSSYLDTKNKHFALIIVDDDGNIIIK